MSLPSAAGYNPVQQVTPAMPAGNPSEETCGEIIAGAVGKLHEWQTLPALMRCE